MMIMFLTIPKILFPFSVVVCRIRLLLDTSVNRISLLFLCLALLLWWARGLCLHFTSFPHFECFPPPMITVVQALFFS